VKRKLRWRELSLRARLSVLVAVAVAVAVILVSLISWQLTRANLYDEFDAQLASYAQIAAKAGSPAEALDTLQAADRLPESARVPVRTFGLTVQFLDGNGTPIATAGDYSIPVGPAERLVADGTISAIPEAHHIDSERFRVWTAHRPGGGAVQVARNSEDVEGTLTRLGLLQALISALGVLGAALVGRAVARSALRPVDTLTAAAEDIARTQELSSGIDVRSRGEIGRLAGAFNAMLSALGRSRDEQRRLVEDAGHELRTPLTSLRNNIELLIHAEAHGDRTLPPEDRTRLLGDLDTQAAELTTLIEELVDLSKGDRSPEPVERVDLADVARSAVERARSRAPHVEFATDLVGVEIDGRASALERAVLNVLDNAAKWSPPAGKVTVRVGVDTTSAKIVVEDEGPGIADADLPHVFERFYRADAARALPGSGLGLAIVEQIVTQHGGSARAGRAESGGAHFELSLPLTAS
jgi:two-component system sensor histidine kinase MprB